MAISSEERDFFIAMGARITLLRKTQGITQAQLAETLGVSQQTVQAYEVGRRRIQVSALPVVARALSISLEELLGEGKAPARSRRGPAPKWGQQIEAISKLPRSPALCERDARYGAGAALNERRAAFSGPCLAVPVREQRLVSS